MTGMWVFEGSELSYKEYPYEYKFNRNELYNIIKDEIRIDRILMPFPDRFYIRYWHGYVDGLCDWGTVSPELKLFKQWFLEELVRTNLKEKCCIDFWYDKSLILPGLRFRTEQELLMFRLKIDCLAQR